jgi:hypothetical protein
MYSCQKYIYKINAQEKGEIKTLRKNVIFLTQKKKSKTTKLHGIHKT